MTWIERNLPWVLLTLVVVTSLAVGGIVGVGTLTVLAGLLGGAPLSAVFADVAILFGITVGLLAAEVVLTVSLVVTIVRRASLPKSERFAASLSLIERLIPPLRGLELARRFEPTLDDRKRALKRRYVDGEISEATFEREMHDLLDESESATDVGTVERKERRQRTASQFASTSQDRDREFERE